MEEPASARWFDAFAPGHAPRSAHARHRVCALCVIARCAVIRGAAGWEDRAESGQAQAEGFQQCLALPQGMPSPDTLRRVRSWLQPDELPQGVVRWTEALRESLAGDSVASEGNTWRRSFEHAASTGARHMGSAGATAQRLVLGPLTVADQSNAITALPQLLRR